MIVLKGFKDFVVFLSYPFFFVLFCGFVSAGFVHLNGSDNDFADVYGVEVGAHLVGTQIKFNISLIPVNQKIDDAEVCVFFDYVDGGPDKDVRYWRVDNQTWDENLSVNGWTKMVLTNQTDSNLSSISQGNYSCINITNVVATDYDAGYNFSSVRFQDLDDLSGTINVVNDATWLYIGEWTKYFRIEDREDSGGTGNFPYLNVTYHVDNHRPNVTGYNLSPVVATTLDTLFGNVTCHDVDASDTITAFCRFYNDSDVFGVFGGVVSNDTASNVCNVTSDMTLRGQNWTVEFWCGDGSANSTFFNSTVYINNSWPRLRETFVLPSTAYFNDTIYVLFNLSDYDSGDVLSANISWYNGSVLFASNISVSCSNGLFCNYSLSNVWNVFEIWNVSVLGFDDLNVSFANYSFINISNYAPYALGVTVSPSPADASEDLNCSYVFFDPENGSQTSYYRWFRNGSYLSAVGNSFWLRTGNYSYGDNISCQVIPFDGFVNGSGVNSSVLFIGDNSTPIISNVSVSTSSVVVGSNVYLYARCNDSESGVSSVKFQIFKTGDAVYDPAINVSVSGVGQLYKLTRIFSTTGVYEWQNVFCDDNSGNGAVNVTGINITVTIAGSTPPGGGGGTSGESDLGDIVSQVQAIVREEVICGNGICQTGESWFNCAEDCPVNLDSILCWPPWESKCLFGQTWFINWGGIFVLILFFIEVVKKKKPGLFRRKNSKRSFRFPKI